MLLNCEQVGRELRAYRTIESYSDPKKCWTTKLSTWISPVTLRSLYNFLLFPIFHVSYTTRGKDFYFRLFIFLLTCSFVINHHQQRSFFTYSWLVFKIRQKTETSSWIFIWKVHRHTRRTLSQFCSFKIRRTKFLNCIKSPISWSWGSKIVKGFVG